MYKYKRVMNEYVINDFSTRAREFPENSLLQVIEFEAELKNSAGYISAKSSYLSFKPSLSSNRLRNEGPDIN